MFKRMFPELHVSDCEAAAVFFEHALGFRRGYAIVEKGVLDFIIMEHVEARLQLFLHHMLPPAEVHKPRHTRLYFEPVDIEGLCRSLRRKGYNIEGPQHTGYGAIEAHMLGPDGHTIWFQQWTNPVPALPQIDL